MIAKAERDALRELLAKATTHPAQPAAAAFRAPLRRAQRVVGQVGAFSYVVAPVGGRLPWAAEEWKGAARVRVRRYAAEEAADRRVDIWMNNRTLMEANPL